MYSPQLSSHLWHWTSQIHIRHMSESSVLQQSIFITNNNDRTQDDGYSAVNYGKAIERVHSGHLNEHGLMTKVAANS